MSGHHHCTDDEVMLVGAVMRWWRLVSDKTSNEASRAKAYAEMCAAAKAKAVAEADKRGEP